MTKLKFNSFRSLFLSIASLLVFSSILTSSASATGLEEALFIRENFAFSENISSRSFDGANFDALSNFSEFISGSDRLLEIGTFDSSVGGSSIEVTLLSEICGFCGHDPENTNAFGVINQEGQFNSILDTLDAVPGSSSTLELNEGDSATFALRTPEAIFSSVDSQNEDQSAHILGAIVEEGGTVNIAEADLNGTSLSYDLLPGDILLFIEDLLATGNTVSFVPDGSDFDFNDLVILLRDNRIFDLEAELTEPNTGVLADSEELSEEVPEPSTVILLGAALIGLAARKRKA